MDNKKIYTCRNDRMFKEIFMNEKNKDILIVLLESILNIKIIKLTYLNLEKNVDRLKVRRKHFDLHVKTDAENIQIEVNGREEDYLRPRNASYIFNTYSKVVERGKDYNEDIKVIQINFTYGLKEKENVRLYRLQDETSKKYVNNLFIYEFNMDNYKSLWYSNDKEKDRFKYLVMMDLKLDELEELSKKDKVVSKYMSEVKRVNDDEYLYEYISAEEDDRKIENSLKRAAMEKGLAEGIEKGLAEGREKGKMETTKEIVRKMIKKGLSRDDILEITGIDINKGEE